MAFNHGNHHGALEKSNKASGIKPARSPYGGFWARLGALFIDIIIWSPIVALMIWMNSHSRLFQVYWWPFGVLLSIFYNIYLVKRFGGTPGKLLLGLKITKEDGSPVGYKEAMLRELPYYIFGLFSFLALAIALLQMSDAEYAGFASRERIQHIKALKPVWAFPAYVMQQVWMWSEFVVLLTNKKKRALHDFIAGTVVTQKAALPQAEATR